jgi:tRNA A-37 threonylcarbamoyl transferase component Bud32
MSNIIGVYETYIIKRYTKGAKFLQTETKFYQQLDGHSITPKLLEVGKDYIKIEKYDTTLEEALIHNLISRVQYYQIYNKIVSLVKKLDKLGIIHNDLAPRNVVCKDNFNTIALIDFELSVIVDKTTSNASNFDGVFYNQFNMS